MVLPPDIVAFARELRMEMKVPLGSRVNACELFEFIEVIELTRFQDVPDSWSDRWSHPL